jgi:predicted CXXCH cytochrome family protein
MPAQETGKQRATRIPLDYYKHSDALERWKVRLGGLALVVTLAWIGTHFALSEQRDFHASRGTVAAVHQTWNAECSACHVNFTPVSSHSWSPFFLHHPKESSTRCQVCHAGTAHHPTQNVELSCGSCHREHRGPEASLVRLPDTDCTQCHKDLGNHGQSGKTIFQHDVPGFAEQTHPPFRSIAKDPGRLKFDHRRHLTAGIPVIDDTGKGGKIRKLGDIPDPYKKRYQDQQNSKDDNAPLQLQCASCHQLDAGDFGTPTRNAGAYMLPISYENHCQACHPLTVERNVFDDPKFGHLTVPHRWQAKEIHGFLENFVTTQVARGQADFREKKVVRPLPGKLAEFLPPTAGAFIDQKVKAAETHLYATKQSCALCHEFTKEYDPLKQVSDLRIEPTNVPQVWLKHAKFNHTAHRAVQCAECHAKADDSRSNADVLIPDRDNCVQCHAPTTKAGTPGARFNCTECHLYHNGDHGVQGVGAGKRNPEKGRDIESFLRGK